VGDGKLIIISIMHVAALYCIFFYPLHVPTGSVLLIEHCLEDNRTFLSYSDGQLPTNKAPSVPFDSLLSAGRGGWSR